MGVHTSPVLGCRMSLVGPADVREYAAYAGWRAVLALAEAFQHKPTVDDERSARDDGTVGAPSPHSQFSLGPADRGRDHGPYRSLYATAF